VVDIPDVIRCFKFGDDRFRGLASAEGQILPFPIDIDGRPYNTLTLPCEHVICSAVVPLVQCYVFNKLEVCMDLLFRENRRHGTDEHTDGTQRL